jgi:hypothetical protein
MIPALPFLWLSRHAAVSLPPSWPPYLSPGWIAAYLVGALAWLAIYELGGLALVAVIVMLGASLAIAAGWWMHTWSDRQRGELPRARARARARRNSGRR